MRKLKSNLVKMINKNSLQELQEIIRVDFDRDFNDEKINQIANELMGFFEFLIDESRQ